MSPVTPTRHRLSRSAALALLLALGLLALAGIGSPPAQADQTQVTILEDDTLVLDNPVGALTEARALGVSTLRFDLPWAAIAPDTHSLTRPRFNATDPAAYGAGAWAPYDAVILAAHQLGITVDLDLAPGAPRWATGPGQPRKPKGYPHWQWEPDPVQFGYFAQAAGERYSGNWNPRTNRLDPGNPDDLPRVGFWSIWNEPNYGPSLAPQALPGHPGVEDSPRIYRELVDAAWRGLAASGHRTPADTILIGELAPRSELTAPNAFGDFNGMTPLVFLQNLYCLTPAYRPLTGVAAALRGCPATAAGSRRFVADNPGLFDNSGMSDHPYDEWFAPDQELDVPKLRGWAQENTQDTSLATIGVLSRGLQRLLGAYGVHRQLPIWDTEYGYQTDPPHRPGKGQPPWPSPARAAYYDNWAEYLQWRNPQIKSFDQYLLQDAVPALRSNDFGAFASGLINYNGTPKADLSAFRMPIYLPRTVAGRPGQTLQVWGDVRPSVFLLDENLGGPPPRVRLLFRPRGAHRFTLLTTLPLRAEGYYDAPVPFTASGTLEAQWQTPRGTLAVTSGTTLLSRPVGVTVR
jgi:hypothetical protein